MSVITFYTSCPEQAGNTTSALALATYLGIEHNKKTLLISTSFNDDTIKDALWPEKNKVRSGLFGPNTGKVSDNGIEGLDRIVRSNKISPQIITDYTKVALKNRLEVLFGYHGVREQYMLIQNQYPQIIMLADKVYDTVIVDLDRRVNEQVKQKIFDASDIILNLTTQKLKNMVDLNKKMSELEGIRKLNSFMVLTRYDDASTYNAKNVSRNLLRKKELVNTIPYNTNVFDAMQSGKTIDIFIRMMGLRIKDENTFFIEEIKRLSKDIDKRILEIKQMGITK